MTSPLNILINNALAVLGLVGVMGNVVSLVIWTRPSIKSSSSTYLVGIAAVDLLIDSIFVTRTFLINFAIMYSISDPSSHLIYPFFYIWAPAVYSVARTASTYLTLAMSLERYVAVCRPFEFRRISTGSRAPMYTMAIIIVAIVYSLPLFLSQKIVAIEYENGETGYYNVYTDLYKSSLFQTIYELRDTWLRLFFIDLLPVSCIFVLNVLIYLEMKKSEKLRIALSTSEMEENKMTRMLVYVVSEFLVCSSAGILYFILEILDISKEHLWVDWQTIIFLDNLFVVINSSSNIFMYVVVGSSFRKTLFATFSCLRCCRLKLPTRTADRELGLRMPTAPTSQPSNCKQIAEVHV